MQAKDYISRPLSSASKLKEHIARTPHKSQFPAYYESINEQHWRHDVEEPLKINVKDFDIYQIEREIEDDVLAKSERHEIRQQLADYIESQSVVKLPMYAELVEKLRFSRTSGVVGICPDGRHLTAWDDKVNCVRVCPDEAREECQRISRKYAPEIFRLLKANPNWRIYFAVYTEPNVNAGSLRDGKKQQYKRFANMHRSRWFKDRVKGSFVIQEDPLSRHDDWNVHLNAIHVVDGDFSYKELRQQWGNNVDVQQITGSPEHIAKAFMEAVKYAAKHIGEKSQDGKHTVAPGMTSWSFDRFHEWFVSGKGFRRSRTYGCLFRFKGIADKGTPLEDVSWIGSINHDGTAYQVRLKKNVEALLKVDLIQADKSAIHGYERYVCARDDGESPPPN